MSLEINAGKDGGRTMTTSEKVRYAVQQFEVWNMMVKDETFLYLCPIKIRKGSCPVCDEYDLRWITKEVEHLLKLIKEENAT